MLTRTPCEDRLGTGPPQARTQGINQGTATATQHAVSDSTTLSLRERVRVRESETERLPRRTLPATTRNPAEISVNRGEIRPKSHLIGAEIRVKLRLKRAPPSVPRSPCRRGSDGYHDQIEDVAGPFGRQLQAIFCHPARRMVKPDLRFDSFWSTESRSPRVPLAWLCRHTTR